VNKNKSRNKNTNKNNWWWWWWWYPCGFAGTGHAGTGAGDQIVIRDIPVPIWAGDGYVTGS